MELNTNVGHARMHAYALGIHLIFPGPAKRQSRASQHSKQSAEAGPDTEKVSSHAMSVTGLDSQTDARTSQTAEQRTSQARTSAGGSQPRVPSAHSSHASASAKQSQSTARQSQPSTRQSQASARQSQPSTRQSSASAKQSLPGVRQSQPNQDAIEQAVQSRKSSQARQSGSPSRTE